LSQKLSKGDADKAFGDALTDFDHENSIQNEDQQLLHMFMGAVVETTYTGKETDLCLATKDYYACEGETRYLSAGAKSDPDKVKSDPDKV